MTNWYKKFSAEADIIDKLADDYISYGEQRLYDLMQDTITKTAVEGEQEKRCLRYKDRVFALVDAAIYRVHGFKLHKEQIAAGLALYEGNIVEQKTGEGKTLTAIAPAVLRSLEYKGSHIVTVNPYLAKRDADNCTQIVKYLGLTVGCVLPDTSPVDRKRAYKADITYVSNTELGFDYLRDNLVVDNFNKVQRGFHFAIVDEADSILIDEAKTPLIISGQGKDVSLLYMRCMAAVNKLKQGTESREFNKSDDYLGIEREVTGDFIVHEKDKNTILTDEGVKHLEEFLSLKNYADAENRAIQHVVEQCLRARALMKRDKDYIVRGGKIVIVDENTGRTMEGRQYADGLHQAIEAKEGVQISTSNETIGTTTYQNFFRKYKILSGMTGTAATEKREFKSTYGLNVKVIPTHEPVIRVDEKDILFVHENDKYKAIVKRVKEEIAQGRPVLCGTATVEASQDLSNYFKDAGIEHQLLNAKQDEHEAQVVAQAGISGTVTIATNMAGRGTDIKLDEKARKAGGLVVIGCEKHESRRIDNQLRGRSGRQGDPGVSVFYCSCDDRVIRLYGGDALKKKLENTALDTGEPITNKSIYKALELSQKRVEADNFAQRRDTLEYDDVDNIQRERVYAERDKILNKNRCSGDVKEAIIKAVQNIMNKLPQDEWVAALESQMGVIIPSYIGATNKSESEYSYRSWIEREIDNVEFVNDNARESYCRKVLLMALDSCWSEQLKALEFARDASGYAGFAQIDPKAAYANEAWRLYGRMQDSIYAGVLFLYFHNRPDKIDVDGISIKAKKGMNV